MKTTIRDNGGRRHVADRRRYSPWNYFPERRATYRRSGWDRRQIPVTSIAITMERREACCETAAEEVA